jgi:hypothetical protein
MREEPGLSIGDVAARTGISVPTLRAWEARHGFPVPQRLASGHRRYREADVAVIEQLLRERASGLSLSAALARVARAAGAAPVSIFAGLREMHPHLTSHVLTKRAMFAISRALEDECAAVGGASLLVGAFQQERFYRASERRWRALAGTVAQSIVIADFSRVRRRRGWPAEVAAPSTAAIAREWAVVCDGPVASGVLSGWERLSDRRRPDHRRRFEAFWSADPAVVRDAAVVALGIAAGHGGDAVSVSPADLPPVVDDPVAALRHATALTNRIVAYLS